MAVKGARRSVFVEVAAFPLSQLVVLVLLYARAFMGPANAPQWSMLFAVTALCVVVDVVLIRAIADETRHRLVSERVRILEEQKELQRQQYQRLREELDEARCVRRDIVEALSESCAFLKRAEVPQAVASMERAVGLSGGIRESYCENRVVNALIMMKLRRCAEEDIEVSCTVVVPEHLHILDMDLCAAFSNLLDNAINGCLAVPPDRRRIEVRACLVAGVMMVDVRNSAAAPQADGKASAEEGAAEGCRAEDPGSQRRWGRSDRWRRLRTGPSTLARRHGWGLQILEVLAIRYNGTFEYGRESDHEFRATLMLMNEKRERL